jgi:hypothetical protein
LEFAEYLDYPFVFPLLRQSGLPGGNDNPIVFWKNEMLVEPQAKSRLRDHTFCWRRQVDLLVIPSAGADRS